MVLRNKIMLDSIINFFTLTVPQMAIGLLLILITLIGYKLGPKIIVFWWFFSGCFVVLMVCISKEIQLFDWDMWKIVIGTLITASSFVLADQFCLTKIDGRMKIKYENWSMGFRLSKGHYKLKDKETEYEAPDFVFLILVIWPKILPGILSFLFFGLMNIALLYLFSSFYNIAESFVVIHETYRPLTWSQFWYVLERDWDLEYGFCAVYQIPYFFLFFASED
jgi:hypothetical protein